MIRLIQDEHYRIQIVTSAGVTDVTQLLGLSDQAPADHSPDDCWRCDSAPATTAVGLCHPCHADLTT